MKKTCLIMSMILLTTSLAGCGASSKSSQEATMDARATEAAAETTAAAAIIEAMPGGIEHGDYPNNTPKQSYSSEQYLDIAENRMVSTEEESMLTFSLKVDTAAYSNVERFIEDGQLPPREAVKTEELINYFNYDSEVVFGDESFGVYTEVAPSPCQEGKYLGMVRVKTPEIDKELLPPSNLVFLIDTSGSMYSYDKLPLLQESFSLLTESLSKGDKISIVTYAGNSGVALDSCDVSDSAAILKAVNSLEAGGSTAGSKGIETAYELAQKNFIADGNNRVILATDGDFNVGITSLSDLEKLIARKRESGIYLSVLGFGTGNIRDDIMETLAKNGNGNYSYIHSQETAQKVLVEEMGSNLFTVASDVKAQVEFNPQNVKSYRLIGYENRMMDNRDFKDDTRDAGEIGVGTDVVIMFELELAGAVKYKYQEQNETAGELTGELFEVRIRYKDPGAEAAKQVDRPFEVTAITAEPSSDFRFAASVVAWAEQLRGSDFAREYSVDQMYEEAKAGLGKDQDGYRIKHLMLLSRYGKLVK